MNGSKVQKYNGSKVQWFRVVPGLLSCLLCKLDKDKACYASKDKMLHSLNTAGYYQTFN